MFDIGASELLVIVIVAILVIGPKDMPRALRTAGRWIGKIRRASSHFRTGIDAMIREAELEEMEKKWKSQNAEIMARPGVDEEAKADAMTGLPAAAPDLASDADSRSGDPENEA
ncbi:MAG: twin arginine-targeting protein translocase TatB [Erythrobacter sp. RIFCSPHIGHO2_12_FULL_63_10]|nr:MAG: twin arginine-targeting protein translocase TatB [Erythrobacter sp. RIFCSPHIGHO2_12_FULL_63_10]